MLLLSRTTTEAAVSGQSGTSGSEIQNFCYDEQNRLIWASNNAAVPSAGNGTCGSATYQNTMGGNYTNQYTYTNLGQLWQGPMNGDTYKLNDHAYNSLFKSGRKDVMPADVIAALSEEPHPGTPGSVEYVNPQTGTSVFVNPNTHEIVGVWPGTFKR